MNPIRPPHRSTALVLAALMLGLVLAACSQLPPIPGLPGGNRAPSADAGSDRRVAIGERVALDGSGSIDPDGDALTYSWRLSSIPAGSTAELESDQSVSTAFTADVEGEYRLELTVGDAEASASDEVVISAAPIVTVTPGSTSVTPGGVGVGLPDGAFEGPVELLVGAASDPSEETPLPAGTTVLGEYFTIGTDAGGDLVTPPESPFLIGLPIPDGAATANLAMLIRTPTDELDLDFKGTEDEGPYTPDAAWTYDLLPGVIDADAGYFLGNLPDVTEAGRVIALVRSDDAESPTLRAPTELERQQLTIEIGFDARCRGFGALDRGNECSTTSESLAAQALEDAYNDFIGLGFRQPDLLKRVRWGGFSDPLVVEVDYLIDLRPFQTDDDWDGVCKVDAGGSGNHGRYNKNADSIVVCFGAPVNSGAGDFDGGRVDTLRHEYFHASQYPYTGSATSWFKESTAVAAQDSLATMVRDNRGARDVDVRFTDDDQKYSLQDFWIYLGDRFGIGIADVIPFLEAGGNLSALDSVLSNRSEYSGSGGLGDTYWDWVKNQLVEKRFDLGSTDFDVLCGFDLRGGDPVALFGGADPLAVAYNRETPPRDRSFTLQPLDATIVRIDFAPRSATPYSTTVRIVPTGGATSLRAKFYDIADRDTTACHTTPDGLSRSFTVQPGQAQSWWVLVANTDTSSNAGFRLDFTPDAPAVTIVEPSSNVTLDEGDSLTLRADVRGFVGADPDQVITTWSYPNYAGTQITLGNTDDDETLTVDGLCDGRYDITARSVDASGSGSASDSVSVTIRNASPPPAECAPSIDIVTPDDGAVFTLGSIVDFEAVIDDDDPSTEDPIYPIIWREGGPSGLIIARDTLSFSRDKWSAGFYDIYVAYGSASDTITIEIRDTSNDPPSATIASPADGAILQWDDYFDGSSGVDIPVSGSGSDPEDGTLSGSSLVWEYREAGTTQWFPAGTGTSTTLGLPLRSPSETWEIRLTATDGDGLSDSDIHTITVVGPPS